MIGDQRFDHYLQRKMTRRKESKRTMLYTSYYLDGRRSPRDIQYMPLRRWVNWNFVHYEVRDPSSYWPTRIKSSFTSPLSSLAPRFASQETRSNCINWSVIHRLQQYERFRLSSFVVYTLFQNFSVTLPRLSICSEVWIKDGGRGG